MEITSDLCLQREPWLFRPRWSLRSGVGPPASYDCILLTPIFIAIIGLAFPLYNAFVTYFLATRGADFGDGSVYITYRNQAILSVIGVPGALLGGWAVEVPFLGRRGTLSITTGECL
jgi:hypothetical protein